ncbi:MAG: MCE family protein [Carbonactinosporaceae bacterium]
MKTTSALVKLVIFAVVTSLATGVLAATIGNIRFVDTKEYTAVFEDVTGLVKGDDVRIAGVRVGHIEDIEIKDRTLAEITMSVDADHPLSRSTQAAIRYRNLLGQRYVALMEGPGSTSPLPDGGSIPPSRTEEALDLNALFNGFKPLFQALSPNDVNTFAFEIIQTLQGEGSTINGLLAHTASLTNTLADRDQVIGRVIDNLNQLLGTVHERDQRLANLIVQLQRFMSGLAADRDAIGDSLENINALTAETAGLVDEGRPAIETDIARLSEVAGTLEKHQPLIDDYLNRLPGKLTEITRTATYGSWFNFYLCDFEGKVVIPQVVKERTVNFHTDVARCQP